MEKCECKGLACKCGKLKPDVVRVSLGRPMTKKGKIIVWIFVAFLVAIVVISSILGT